MFRARDSHDLRVLQSQLIIEPRAQVRWMHDAFSNSITVIELLEPASELRLESRIRIQHFWLDEPDDAPNGYAERWPCAYSEEQIADLGRTMDRHYPDPGGEIALWVRTFIGGGRRSTVDMRELLGAVTRGIKEGFSYEVRQEHGTRLPHETFARRSGSCRDFALLMMEAVRSLGFAARFVSGYVYDPALDGAEDTMRGAGATHAWVQVFLPNAGWVEFDPTNGIVGGRNSHSCRCRA